MKNCSTNTWSLLKDTQSLLVEDKSNQGLFRGVASVEAGFNRNPSKFPLIAILPVEQENMGIQNGNIKIKHQIRFEILTVNADSRSALRQSIGIGDNLIKTFKVGAPNWLVPDSQSRNTVFNTALRSAIYSQGPIPWRTGFLQRSLLDFEFDSFESIHTPTIDQLEQYSKDVGDLANQSSTPEGLQYIEEYLKYIRGDENVYYPPGITSDSRSPLNSASTKKLVDNIISVFKKYRLNLLKSVKRFRDLILTPNTDFPILFISLESVEPQRRFAGRDVLNHSLRVNILQKSLNPQEALRYVTRLSDIIKHIIISNCDFNGCAIDYSLEGIQYGQFPSNQTQIIGSSVLFSAQTFRDLNHE